MRYTVEYVHLDGNRYPIGAYATLFAAQHYARVKREHSPMIRESRLPVVITDTENPERGNLLDADYEDE